VTERYGVGATSRRVGSVPNSMLGRLRNHRVTWQPGAAHYGSHYYSLYNSWWDPCYSWHQHPGWYGTSLSLWLPWYFYTNHYYCDLLHTCWWDTWSSYCWTPSRYWWYPTTTYCPTWLYVPSSTVIVEAAESAAEPVAEVAAAPAAAGSDLASKYLQLGDFYFKAGRFTEAQDAYARARTYAPDDAALHFVLADAAFAVGDYHFAAFLIAEALRLDPTLAAAKIDKRDFYGERTLFDEHMAALDKHLEADPYDASAHLVRAYNLCFTDRAAAAIVAFERVLEIAPDHRAARIFLEVLQPVAAPGAAAPVGGAATPKLDR
jgi:tetratricopeptide (TPR) repeat protein